MTVNAQMIQAAFRDSLLAETFQDMDWKARTDHSRPAHVEHDPLCVLNTAGFAWCGKVLYQRLPYLRLSDVRPDRQICRTCLSRMLQAVADFRQRRTQSRVTAAPQKSAFRRNTRLRAS